MEKQEQTGKVEVSPVQFPNFPPTKQQSQAGGDKKSITFLHDVSVLISAELGRTEMTIEDVLALGPGSLITLNKRAGDPVDLLINNKYVAEGEIVLIDDFFGIRITRILDND